MLKYTLLVALLITSNGRAFEAPMLAPYPDSPLATDGLTVYAVGADRQSILSARGEKTSWNQFAVIPGAAISGLAWTNGRLYLINTADGSLLSVPTAGGERVPSVVHRGAPFKAPKELAFSGGLFITDPGAATLFHLAAAGAKDALTFKPPTPVATPTLKIGARTFITGWGAGELMVSDAETGVLAELIYDSGGAKVRAVQQRSDVGSYSWNQKPESPEAIRRQGYPALRAPAAIAIFNGIVYVTDAESGNLFIAGAYDGRAVHVPTPEAGVPITRLIAGPSSITALDRQGHLHTFPRTVPSELTLLPGARPQNLFPVLEYLQRRRLLMTRTLAITGSLDDTLLAVRMQWPARGPAAEPETPQGRYASFCMLNPQHCSAGLPKADLLNGTPIVMAELYAERFTSATHAVLDGTRSLGEVADEAITSTEFRVQATEPNLRRINGVFAESAAPLRDAKTGTFRISQELVRYVIPIEASELRQRDSEFSRLVDRVKETLRIAPLERVMTTAASGKGASRPAIVDSMPHDPLHPDDPQCLAARKAMEALLKTVDYAAVPQTRTIFVGVAEDDFDPTHRDFYDANAPNGILYVVTDDNQLKLAATAAPSTPVAPGDEPVKWRKFDLADHGTAIAALIAGRTRPYDAGHGLSNSFIGMFTRTSDATALAKDIDRALNVSNMTIVNLSLRNRGTADSDMMRILMEKQQALALFVVAAPNLPSTITLCSAANRYYPACHGDTFENVLVVGGTTLAGDKIHDESPTGNSVHVFAPEAGYFSAGRDNGYVEVVGTSFATAIVSAAAAMLSSAGVISPALIRQRLISTATVMNIANRPQWARLLDFKRALNNLNRSVLVDPNGNEQVIDIMNKGDTLQFKAGNQPVPVPLVNLRRLRRVPGNPQLFDLAYVTQKNRVVQGLRNEELQLQQVTTAGQPLNVCFLAADGQRTCVDLAEYQDYVGPIQFQ